MWLNVSAPIGVRVRVGFTSNPTLPVFSLPDVAIFRVIISEPFFGSLSISRTQVADSETRGCAFRIVVGAFWMGLEIRPQTQHALEVWLATLLHSCPTVVQISAVLRFLLIPRSTWAKRRSDSGCAMR